MLETPNRLPWPPMIYGALVVAGFVLAYLVPGSLMSLSAPARIAGYTALAAGLAVDAWAMATMAIHRTNILPHRPAGNLVTTGPFAYMRNPIYAGNTVAVAGLGLALGNPWLLGFAPLAAILTHHLAVRREEAHLAAKFGTAWTRYAEKVPAWPGFPKG